MVRKCSVTLIQSLSFRYLGVEWKISRYRCHYFSKIGTVKPLKQGKYSCYNTVIGARQIFLVYTKLLMCD